MYYVETHTNFMCFPGGFIQTINHLRTFTQNGWVPALIQKRFPLRNAPFLSESFLIVEVHLQRPRMLGYAASTPIPKRQFSKCSAAQSVEWNPALA